MRCLSFLLIACLILMSGCASKNNDFKTVFLGPIEKNLNEAEQDNIIKTSLLGLNSYLDEKPSVAKKNNVYYYLMPTRSSNNEDNLFCRIFQTSLIFKNEEWTTVGEACRYDDNWRIAWWSPVFLKHTDLVDKHYKTYLQNKKGGK
ncbi:MAG: hypothetical protein ACOC2M_03650 [bacterium]